VKYGVLSQRLYEPGRRPCEYSRRVGEWHATLEILTFGLPVLDAVLVHPFSGRSTSDDHIKRRADPVPDLRSSDHVSYFLLL
jgi:hypothetical protein